MSSVSALKAGHDSSCRSPVPSASKTFLVKTASQAKGKSYKLFTRPLPTRPSTSMLVTASETKGKLLDKVDFQLHKNLGKLTAQHLLGLKVVPSPTSRDFHIYIGVGQTQGQCRHISVQSHGVSGNSFEHFLNQGEIERFLNIQISLISSSRLAPNAQNALLLKINSERGQWKSDVTK